MRIVGFFILSGIMLFACSKRSDESTPTGKLQGLHTYYYPDGQRYLEINYKDSLPHGTFKQYYKSGQLFEESQYQNGQLHGLSKKFHANGMMSSETSYDMGRIHGTQKKFRKDGTPAFEAQYYYDKPCVGLKEYYISGNPITNYPTIVIRSRNELLSDDRYILEISLSDNSKVVEFFKGELTDNRYIGKDAEKIFTTNGVGKIYYNLPPGTFIMEKLNIIAKVKTDLRNFYITQTSYNLAVENR